MGKPEEGSWPSGKLHRKKSDNNVHIKGFRKRKGDGTAGGLCTYRQRGWRCRRGTIDPMINKHQNSLRGTVCNWEARSWASCTWGR